MTLSFTRTTGGLKNYSSFFNSDVTVFVEGKKHDVAESPEKLPQSVKTSDELFHQAITGLFCSEKRFKIKSVGSKTDLATYAKKIVSGTLSNCAVVFDSDYESVLGSWLGKPRIMRTWGYSWESDLWAPEVCVQVVTLLAGGREWDREKFQIKLSQVSHRLARLSRVEVCSRSHGCNLIVPSGKSVGIALNSKGKFGLRQSEVDRLIKKLRQSLADVLDKKLLSSLIQRMNDMPAPMLVRGHLWEAACITLIAGVLKEMGVAQTLANDNVRNLALGVFSQDPAEYLQPRAAVHYKKQLVEAGFC